MEQFLLILHKSATARPDMSPEEMQAITAKYKAWAGGLAGAGRLLGGNKLDDRPGRTMRLDGGKARVTDGPFAETKDVIGGYFLIQVADYDEAVAVCQDCPHLQFGAIEIRRVEPT